MYVSSKTVDLPTLFGDVLWGLGANVLCTGASIPIEVVELFSFGLVQNPLYCDWDSYLSIFRINSGGTIEEADLRPLYDHEDPVKQLAIVKKPLGWDQSLSGPAGSLPTQNAWPRCSGPPAYTSRCISSLPALGVIVGKGLGKVTKALKAELADVLADSGNEFITAGADPVVDFSATLTRLAVDTLIDKEDIVDVTSPGRRYTTEEKEFNLGTSDVPRPPHP